MRIPILFFILLGWCGSLFGQRGNDFDRPERPGHGYSWNQPREDSTSGSAGASFRQYLMNEMKHVPTLDARLRGLLQVQQQKMALQRERREFIEDSGIASDVVLRRFHDLLGREDALTSRQQELIGLMRADVDKIQGEIAKRRAELSKQADQPEKDEKRFSSYVERRRLQRTIRFYDSISESLAKLKENANESEWIRRISRGGWPAEEIDVEVLEQSRRRIQQLVQEQEDLRRRMQELDLQINELDELLQTVGPAPSRKQGRKEGSINQPQR